MSDANLMRLSCGAINRAPETFPPIEPAELESAVKRIGRFRVREVVFVDVMRLENFLAWLDSP